MLAESNFDGRIVFTPKAGDSEAEDEGDEDGDEDEGESEDS